MQWRGLIFGLVLGGTLVANASAQEQPFLKDRRYRNGIGIRTGNLEVHPGVAAEIGYDSNYFQRADEEQPIDVARLRLSPSVFVSTLGEQRADARPFLNFSGGVAASYNEFFGGGDASDQVSQQRNVGVSANLDFRFNPKGEWGSRVYGTYTRQFQPSNTPDTNFAFDRNIIGYGASVIWSPGGGLVNWSLGYDGQATLFERSQFDNLNNLRHKVASQGRWRFLPRTSLLFDGSVGITAYGEGSPGLNNSTPMRARLGLSGLITTKIAALAMVGWGASFYEATFNDRPVQNFDSVIGQAELKYFLQAAPADPSESVGVGLSTITAGYLRDFYNGYLGDFYQRDRPYLRFNYFLGGVVVVTAEGGYSFISHPDSYFVNDAGASQLRFGAFEENRVDVVLSAEYRITQTVGLNATFRYDANLSENRLPTNADDPTNPDLQDNLQFTRVQAFLGARWFM